MKKSPYDAFQRSVKEMIYSQESFDHPLPYHIYESIQFEDIEQLHHKLFGDLGNFQVYVVSALPVADINQWVTGHLGALPVERPPLCQIPQISPCRGQLVEHASPEHRTFIETFHITEFETRDTQALFAEEILNRVLQKRYTDMMREEYGMDYDPHIYSWGRDGESIHVTTITALIAPDQEAFLDSLWPDIIHRLSKPISPQERAVADLQFERDLQSIRLNGQHMVSALARYGTWGYDHQSLFKP